VTAWQVDLGALELSRQDSVQRIDVAIASLVVIGLVWRYAGQPRQTVDTDIGAYPAKLKDIKWNIEVFSLSWSAGRLTETGSGTDHGGTWNPR
jgi:hypothetical protein